MDMLTRAHVLRLREGDSPMSCAAIATQLAISESSVRRIIQAHSADRKAGLEKLMSTMDVEMLELWVRAAEVQSEKGYYQAMQAWLESSKGIEAKPSVQANVNVTPTVVLNMPFPLGAVAQPATIEAQAVPVLPPKDAA